MKKVARTIGIILLVSLAACRQKDNPDDNPTPRAKEIVPVEYEEIDWTEGERYVWNNNYIPEITVNVPLDEWNALLLEYDRDSGTEMYIHCDVEINRDGDVSVIKDAGIRLRGNTSRRRPEGSKGQLHKEGGKWHKSHFALNLKKFVDDEEHTWKGLTKFHLKWFHEDPANVREIFCFDVFRRAGIWTASRDNYCRLWIHVEGDKEPAYYGVYNLLEKVDKQYLKRRKAQFGSAKGNLWKCVKGADLTSSSFSKIGPDSEDRDYAYELKEYNGTYDEALAQLGNFIRNVSTLGNKDFYEWIRKVCDVDFLLRYYAVNVALGNWDDHWAKSNNYYLYFNSNDEKDYKVFMIPYDMDNALGTSKDTGHLTDAGRQDPYDWGNQGILIKRLMDFDECREIYHNELLRVIDPSSGLLDFESASKKISEFQGRIKSYVKNSTNEGMAIEDKTASWGNHQEYRLLDPDPRVNFFKVKASVIKAMGK